MSPARNLDLQHFSNVQGVSDFFGERHKMGAESCPGWTRELRKASSSLQTALRLESAAQDGRRLRSAIDQFYLAPRSRGISASIPGRNIRPVRAAPDLDPSAAQSGGEFDRHR